MAILRVPAPRHSHLACVRHQVVPVPSVPEEERHKFLGRQFFVIEKVLRKRDDMGKMLPEKRLACYYVSPDGWVFMCPPVDRLIDR